MANTDPMPRGYRSASEYSFRIEHVDAIIRAASYHRIDYDQSTIWFSSHRHNHVRQSIATPFQRKPQSGIGSLDRLPLELLHEILLHMDIHSLFVFRQLSLRSRETVDSLGRYQMIISHGLNLVCALLRTRLAVNISLIDFYEALCTKSCTLCGDFGGFICLLTWERCCFACLQDAAQFQARLLAAVQKQLKLKKTEAAQLTSFKTLPGTYTMNELVYKTRVSVVSLYQAWEIVGEERCSQVQDPLLNFYRNQKFNFMASCALPHYDQKTGKVECGISCAGCQLALEKDIIGSRGEGWAFAARNKVYAQDGFLKHFQWCEQAQLLWESSNEGKSRPPELPEMARRRGFWRNGK